jgi:hypothetical protein
LLRQAFFKEGIKRLFLSPSIMVEQAAFESDSDGGGARIYPEFGVDTGKMGANSTDTQSCSPFWV